MSMRRTFIAGVAGMAFAALFSIGAKAAVISATYNQALSNTPVNISFNGVGAFSFTTVNTGFGPGAWVSTSGPAQVTTLFGSVTDFFSGAFIDQAQLFTFASYPTPTMIPFSAADDFIGLALTLNDGVHYGYAEVAGPNLIGVGFESVAGTTILTGATGTGTGITLTTGSPVATPEPASMALLFTGLAMLGAGRRRTQRGAAA